ncbi:peptidoglycan recognition protein [Streptomyces sp. NPDC014892]|uniref:peptidoglycan recognition protein family protein n=1 Tax=Streptomyces sp. NPDC014892 TaxID=3364930 RepID=UPI003700AB30
MSRGARIRRLPRVWRRRARTPRAPDPSGQRPRRSHDRTRPARERVRRIRERTRLARARVDLPRPVLLLPACLAGLATVLALVLGAIGGDGTAERADGPATTRPAPPHQAPRPPIVPRSRWLEKDAPSQPPARYDDEVAAVFIHHTDSPNGYDCADAPRIIRGLYTGQTDAKHWDDIGYNFLVDRCGTIYEGRAGGVDRAVVGAHTQGFNHRTSGIAALGTFTAGVPVPRAMTDAIAALAAWKLGLSDIDPRGSVRLTSSNSLSRYAAGTTVLLPTLAGHSDGYMTSCPGAALAERLPAIRERAARLQGRI